MNINNTHDKAIDTIIKQVTQLIETKTKKLYYDKTFPSVVHGKNENGTYKIPYENYLYDVPCGLGVELKLGQHVWVTMPSGMKNFRNMYISGLRK